MSDNDDTKPQQSQDSNQPDGQLDQQTDKPVVKPVRRPLIDRLVTHGMKVEKPTKKEEK